MTGHWRVAGWALAFDINFRRRSIGRGRRPTYMTVRRVSSKGLYSCNWRYDVESCTVHAIIRSRGSYISPSSLSTISFSCNTFVTGLLRGWQSTICHCDHVAFKRHLHYSPEAALLASAALDYLFTTSWPFLFFLRRVSRRFIILFMPEPPTGKSARMLVITQSYWKWYSPFDRSHTSSYSSSIVTMAQSSTCIVSCHRHTVLYIDC